LLQNRAAEAVPLAQANYEMRLNTLDASVHPANNAKYHLARALFADSQYDSSELILRELLSEQASFIMRPQNYFDAMSMLGECMLLKKQYEECEPLLVDGYAGMEQRLLRATISKPERQAMYLAAADRLVRLYEATSNPTQLERWRAERKRWESIPQ